MSRVYNKEELALILAKYEIVSVATAALAPCSPLLFIGIDFTIFGCRITRDNFIGPFLAIFSAFFWIFCFFRLHNLTTDPVFELVKPEIFYKTESSVKESNYNNQDGHNGDNHNHNTAAIYGEVKLLTLKDILSNGDLLLIYMSQLWSSQCFFQIDLVLTMYAILVYKFTLLKVGIVSTVAVFSSIGIMFIARKRILNSTKNIYFVLIQCFTLMSLLVSLFLMVDSIELKHFTVQVVFLGTALILNNFIEFGTLICNRILTFSVTPSHSASIVESYRVFIVSCSSAISYFTASLVFSKLSYALPILFVVYNLLVWMLVSKRHRFLPK